MPRGRESSRGVRFRYGSPASPSVYLTIVCFSAKRLVVVYARFRGPYMRVYCLSAFYPPPGARPLTYDHDFSAHQPKRKVREPNRRGCELLLTSTRAALKNLLRVSQNLEHAAAEIGEAEDKAVAIVSSGRKSQLRLVSTMISAKLVHKLPLRQVDCSLLSYSGHFTPWTNASSVDVQQRF